MSAVLLWEVVDHNLANGEVVIPAGATSSSLSFNVMDDQLDEPEETIIITLFDPTGATLGSVTTHTHTIIDND